MSMTDPVSDLLARIRNAIGSKHNRLDVPTSKIKVEVCRILSEEGYIDKFRTIEGKPVSTLRVHLRYDESGQSAITHLARISKPGRRVYRGADEIAPVRNGLGTGIISTSKGLVSDSAAREQRVGGEILCEVW